MIYWNTESIKKLISDQSTYDPTGNRFLDQRYANRTDEFEYHRLFYQISKILKPKLFVELGGYEGTCAAHVAVGNPDCISVSIDHHSDPGDDQNKQRMIECTSTFPNMRYIQGWTWNVANKVASMGKIDFLFIDSWHHYDKAIQDWKIYSPLLADNSLVVCDDIVHGKHDEEPIWRMDDFFDTLPGEKFLSKKKRPHKGYPMGFLKFKRRFDYAQIHNT